MDHQLGYHLILIYLSTYDANSLSFNGPNGSRKRIQKGRAWKSV